MRGAAKVPFTQSPEEEEEKLISLNVPLSLHAYLKQHGLKATVIRAVGFDRDLGELTKPLQERINDFAKAKGLTLTHNAAAVVAQLLERGLESWEAEQKKRK